MTGEITMDRPLCHTPHQRRVERAPERSHEQDLRRGGIGRRDGRPARAIVRGCNGPDRFRVAAEILELLDVTGGAKLGEQMGGTMTAITMQQVRTAHPDITKRYIEIAEEEIIALIERELGVLTDRMVPPYARHITRDDVRGLIAFYRTDLGRKTIEVMPAIMQDSIRMGQEWGIEVTPKLMRAIEKRLGQEGYTPRNDG